MRRLVAALVLLAAVSAPEAYAVVLYKLTDRTGHVTYADAVPRGFDGAVARLDIDSGANSVPAAEIPRVLATPDYASIIRRRPDTSAEDGIAAARLRLDAARAALEDARNNSTAEDWIYLGPRNPLGMRRMPRPEYEARLAGLEREVIVAEESLDALRREAR